MQRSPNLLLNCLSPEVYEGVRPHLAEARLERGAVLAEAGMPVQKVYFPHSGAVSLVVEMSCGDTVETAMIGRDGAVNALAALDHKSSVSKALVLFPVVASAVSVERLSELSAQFDELRGLLVRHQQVLFGEVQQAGACNAIDVIEARLCRWLLRARDLVDSDEIPITQDFLAQMLGVRRPSVSVVAATLQRAGMIKYQRGHVTILDVKAMQESACECYEAVRAHYLRLLSPGET